MGQSVRHRFSIVVRRLVIGKGEKEWGKDRVKGGRRGSEVGVVFRRGVVGDGGGCDEGDGKGLFVCGSATWKNVEGRRGCCFGGRKEEGKRGQSAMVVVGEKGVRLMREDANSSSVGSLG
ncbi:hypothetical protein GOBAR_AA15821 [Gossypium barbadense]|uniref:Uncharacterized protein n=1 Tax=Gossypium barbadense TaxID=3634 RepID=A0A2P5XNE9_GOSBA|nr:hypothetical protein GOBAR_AA15821 [Gossypium barbadense]